MVESESESDSEAGNKEPDNVVLTLESAVTQTQPQTSTTTLPALAVESALRKDVDAIPKLQDVNGRVENLLRHMQMFGSPEAVQQLFEVFCGQHETRPKAGSQRNAQGQPGGGRDW